MDRPITLCVSSILDRMTHIYSANLIDMRLGEADRSRRNLEIEFVCPVINSPVPQKLLRILYKPHTPITGIHRSVVSVAHKLTHFCCISRAQLQFPFLYL